MKFKAWLIDEIALGSDGVRDNEPSQTAQATQKSSQILQKSPDFNSRQTNWMGMSGNPSALNKTFVNDINWGMSNVVPNQIAKGTNAGNVAFNMSQTTPIKGLNIPKPNMFMRKMRKGMKK